MNVANAWPSIRSGVLLGATVVLTACGGMPTTPDRVEAPKVATGGVADYQRRLEETAAQQERQGRLADAAVSVELLAMLEPKKDAYSARLESLRARIDTAASARLQRGADAFKRGQLDVATSHYLAVLALQPDNETAASALRGIEKERNRRLLAARLRSRKPAAAPGSGD